jgi:hypothetical protein
VYAAEDDGRIVVLDDSGALVTIWPRTGAPAPISLAAAGDGDVLVAEPGRLVRVHPDGTVHSTMAAPGWEPLLVAARPSGHIVLAGPHAIESRPALGDAHGFGAPAAFSSDFAGVAVIDGGTLAVGQNPDRIAFVDRLGLPVGLAALSAANGIADLAARGSTGLVLPVEAWAASQFAPDGRLQGTLRLPATAGGYLGLDSTGDGGLLLAGADGLIRRLDADGAEAGVWSGAGHPSGAFELPSDVEEVSTRVAVAEARRIRWLDESGGYAGESELPEAAERRWIAGLEGDSVLVTGSGALLASAPGAPVRSLPVPVAGGDLTGVAAEGGYVYAAESTRGVHVLGPADGPWLLRAFPNRWVGGTPSVAWESAELVFDWGLGPPAPGLPADWFSVTANRTVTLPAGESRFTVEADGGVRLWVGPRLVLDAPGGGATTKVDVTHPAGPIALTVEFNDPGGRAALALDWQTTTGVASSAYMPSAAATRR